MRMETQNLLEQTIFFPPNLYKGQDLYVFLPHPLGQDQLGKFVQVCARSAQPDSPSLMCPLVQQSLWQECIKHHLETIRG